MKKVAINYWLDILAFIEFAFLTSTGILVQYSLPERSGHLTIWGLTRHEWGDIHFYIAIALFATMSLHIFLHWKWIVNLTRGHNANVDGRRLLLGVFSLIVVILLAAAPLTVTVEGEPTQQGGRGLQLHRQ